MRRNYDVPGRQHDGGDLKFLFQVSISSDSYAYSTGNKQKLEIHEHPHSYDLTVITETSQDSSHAWSAAMD